MISRRKALSRELRLQIGRRLRELRLKHSASQEAVAWAADVTQGSISNYENGRNETPLSVLISICEYFDTPLTEVFATTVVSGDFLGLSAQPVEYETYRTKAAVGCRVAGRAASPGAGERGEPGSRLAVAPPRRSVRVRSDQARLQTDPPPQARAMVWSERYSPSGDSHPSGWRATIPASIRRSTSSSETSRISRST